MNENVDVVIIVKRPETEAAPEQLSGVFSAGPPIQIQWPQPNGLGNSANLVHDYYEWFVTPCSV